MQSCALGIVLEESYVEGDGRFATLAELIDHYISLFGLTLSDCEENDLIEYVKSLQLRGSTRFRGVEVPAFTRLVVSTACRAVPRRACPRRSTDVTPALRAAWARAATRWCRRGARARCGWVRTSAPCDSDERQR